MERLNFSTKKSQKGNPRIPSVKDLTESENLKAFLSNTDFKANNIIKDHESTGRKPCDAIVINNYLFAILMKKGELAKQSSDSPFLGSSDRLLRVLQTRKNAKQEFL